MSDTKLIFAIEHVADSLSSSNYELSKVIGSCTDSIISSNDKVVEGLSVISDTINSPRLYDWLILASTVFNIAAFIVLTCIIWYTNKKQTEEQINIQKSSLRLSLRNEYQELHTVFIKIDDLGKNLLESYVYGLKKFDISDLKNKTNEIKNEIEESEYKVQTLLSDENIEYFNRAKVHIQIINALLSGLNGKMTDNKEKFTICQEPNKCSDEECINLIRNATAFYYKEDIDNPTHGANQVNVKFITIFLNLCKEIKFKEITSRYCKINDLLD